MMRCIAREQILGLKHEVLELKHQLAAKKGFTLPDGSVVVVVGACVCVMVGFCLACLWK